MSNAYEDTVDNVQLNIAVLLDQQIIKKASAPVHKIAMTGTDDPGHNEAKAILQFSDNGQESELRKELDRGQFCSFQFRGPEMYVNVLHHYLKSQTSAYLLEDKLYLDNGILEVTVFYEDMMELIEKFPTLKAAGFWVAPSGYRVYAFFSDTGSSSITKVCFAGDADPRSDGGEWYIKNKVTASFRNSFMDTMTSHRCAVSFKFPWRTQWEKLDYFIKHDGIYYQMTGAAGLSEHDPAITEWVVVPTYDDYAEIVQYKGTDTELHFPEQVGDLIITGIGEREAQPAKNYRNLTAVTIPDTYQKIGANAFRGCSKLKKVTLPSRMAIIGECAFKDCTELEEVILPSDLQDTFDQGQRVFSNCPKLKDVYTQQWDPPLKGRIWFEKCAGCVFHGPEGSPAASYVKGGKFVPLTLQDRQMFIDRVMQVPVRRYLSTDLSFKDLPRKGDVLIFKECEDHKVGLCRTDGSFVGYLYPYSDLQFIHDAFAAKVISDPYINSWGGRDWGAELKLIPATECGTAVPFAHGIRYIPKTQLNFRGKIFVLDDGLIFHGELNREIERRGGTIKRNITLGTDYLIINPRWQEPTQKRDAAAANIANGKSTRIITYQEFFDMIMAK